jgi:uncharacterized protein
MNASLTLRYARTPWARMWGLLGRSTYPAGSALVFERCASVHTWFMRMHVDVVFVDAAWNVVSVAHRVPPWRVVREPRSFAVLELAAGEAQRLGLRAQSAQDLSEARRASVEQHPDAIELA